VLGPTRRVQVKAARPVQITAEHILSQAANSAS